MKTRAIYRELPPQYDYEHAQRVAQRHAQLFGASSLADNGPKRCICGWWSPLFPYTVLPATMPVPCGLRP